MELPDLLGQIKKDKFFAYRDEAFPYTSSIADTFSQLYNGKSLIVSLSSDFQMTSALGVNQQSHYAFNNEIGLYYNTNVRKFQSIYTSEIDTSNLQASWSDILNSISTSSLALPGTSDSISYDDHKFSVHLVSKNLSASFGVASNDIFSFFVELQSIRNIIKELQSNPSLNSMTMDHFPDLFSFSFASMKNIEKKYGKLSNQYKVAIYLLDESINEAMNAFNTLYNNKISIQLVFVAQSADMALSKDKSAKQEIYGIIKQQVIKEMFENNFPVIYVKEGVDKYAVCDVLKATTTFDIYCPDSWAYGGSNYVLTWPNPSNQTVNGTKDAAMFQICLWFPIILGLTLIAIIVAMCTMDIGADSMIYRTTNLKQIHLS